MELRSATHRELRGAMLHRGGIGPMHKKLCRATNGSGGVDSGREEWLLWVWRRGVWPEDDAGRACRLAQCLRRLGALGTPSIRVRRTVH